MNAMDSELCRRLQELDRLEKVFDRKHCRCMVPGCGDNAIKSHSQQRNGAIMAIAEGNHVIAIKRRVVPTLFGAVPNEPPKCDIARIGVRQASVFKGFCSHHDVEIFKSIDTLKLGENKDEQMIALHRRAVAYEIRNKEKMCYIIGAAIGLNENCDRHRQAYVEDLGQLLTADIKYSWNPLWEDNPISNLDYEWVTINKNIGVSLTSCIPPLNDLSFTAYMESCKDCLGTYSRSRPFFSLAIVPEESQTHIVMVWNKFDGSNVDSYRRLLCNPADIGVFLDKCVFDKSEDFCLKPSLWASFDNDVQAAVINKASNTIHDDYAEPLTLFQELLRT